MTISESARLEWRILDYVFHCEGRPLEDCQPLNREQGDAWNRLHHSGALEFADNRWKITQLGRSRYYQYRACQVEGCPYLEVRGSREGDFIDGHFVCPAHATSIGARMARDLFSGAGLVRREPDPPPPPTLEDLARARNDAAKVVTDWMKAEGDAGRLRYNDQAPGWPAYQAAQEKLNAALAAVK